MDLSTIQPQPKVIDILHPKTQEPIGLKITVLPETDKRVKKAQRKNLDAQLNSRKTKLTALQIEANTLALIVAAVESWDWYGDDTTFEGEKPECTPEKVEQVFKKVSWIKDQVREEFDSAEDFFEA